MAFTMEYTDGEPERNYDALEAERTMLLNLPVAKQTLEVKSRVQHIEDILGYPTAWYIDQG